jgi:hypothetical protein
LAGLALTPFGREIIWELFSEKMTLSSLRQDEFLWENPQCSSFYLFFLSITSHNTFQVPVTLTVINSILKR